MPDPVPPLPNEEDLVRFTNFVMRKQAGLSLRVASIFLALILGLPLVNYYFPEVASYSIYGFPANWLFLGVLFYPITVALSFYFVRRSDRIEAECQHWVATNKSGARR